MDARVGKKRGRPRGSRNKKKKRPKTSEANESAGVESSFEAAFGHIPPAAQVDVTEQEDFGIRNDDAIALYEGDVFTGGTLSDLVDAAKDLNKEDCGDGFDYEQQQLDDDDCNVGFGETDVFDVEELIGLAGEQSNKKEDILKHLRDSCVATNSKKTIYQQ